MLALAGRKSNKYKLISLFILVCCNNFFIIAQDTSSKIFQKKDIVKGRYIPDKRKLDIHINENIIPIAVKSIKADSAIKQKFITSDFIKIYFTLNEFGEIITVENIETSFVLSSEERNDLVNKIIGLNGWKPKKKNTKYIYVWSIHLRWI